MACIFSIKIISKKLHMNINSKILIILSLALSVCISCQFKQKTLPEKDTRKEAITTSPDSSSLETFRDIPAEVVDQLNANIVSKQLLSVDQIMQFYSPRDSTAEGNYKYSIFQQNQSDGEKEVTLLEENLMDDATAGRKVIMTLRIVNGNITIRSIKENSRCWPGRGHETWGAELCR
jgi:hypothetical protein